MAQTSPTLVRPQPIPAPHPSRLAVAQPSALSMRGLPTAPYHVLQGQPSAFGALVLGTVLRSALVGAGLYAVGVREPKKLAGAALLASATLSAVGIAHHGHASYARRTA